MAYDIFATIMGEIADQAEAARLAQELAAVVARAKMLGCQVLVYDMRLAEEIKRITSCRNRPIIANSRTFPA